MERHAADICVIEDDDAQRALLCRQLARHKFDVVEAVNGADAFHKIYQHRPRVVICDLMLPDVDGMQICRKLRSDRSLDGTYVILLTAFGERGRKTTALVAGADDYVEKPYDPEELLARIRNGLRYHRLHERLRRAALTDGMTELWNHTHFRKLLEREFIRTRRYGGAVSLIMLDLDHFKAINDTYGHETGNQILKLTARHLQSTVRDADLVARYGGEEFAIVCPETGIDEAAGLAERLRQSLPQEVRAPDKPNVSVHGSFGVVSSDDARVSSVADMIDLADRALYISKHVGRNRVTRADHVDSAGVDGDLKIEEVDRLRKEVVGLNMQAKEICLQSVWALIQALEARDGYSAWHSRNVTLYAKWLAEAAGWPKPLRVAVANAAMLHDLGKIGLPDRLLMTPNPLDPADAALMRQVPLITCKILEPLRVFETEIVMIRHLRERFDGSGYPDGLVGGSIPIGSRVLAITEAFDSITCNRAHRDGCSIDEALERIREAAGMQFDPEFTDLLERTVRDQRKRWQDQVDRARVEIDEACAHTSTIIPDVA